MGRTSIAEWRVLRLLTILYFQTEFLLRALSHPRQ
jgi:hypothetical protein